MPKSEFPDASISRYFRQAARYPRLEREEERELAVRWKLHRDESASEQLILSHLHHVVVIAAKYRRYPVAFADLVSEGTLGLLTALDRYDPEQNTRFITYAAFWIRARIVGYVLGNWSVAKSANGPLRSKLFFAIRRERARTLSEFGAGPEADAELERRMGLNIQRIRKMLEQMEQKDVSLHQSVGRERGEMLLETLASEDAASDSTLAHSQSRQYAQAWVQEALELLDPRERYIAMNRWMADGEDELSLAEIGRRLGVTRERARQLEARAKSKVRAFIERRSRTMGTDVDELLAA